MNLYKSTEFNAMQKGMDYLWQKQQVINHNLANMETPGYKTRSLEFRDALNQLECDSPLHKHSQSTNEQFQTKLNIDENTSIRPDGNNVDTDKESLELWRTYSQYSYLTQKISGQFKNMRYVISQSMK